MQNSVPKQAEPGSAVTVQLLRWLISAGVGAAIYFWVVRSWVAALIAFWYALESWLLIALCFGVHRRDAILTYVLPRVAGTAISFGLAYLVFSRWDLLIALAYIVLLILEGLYRLALRGMAPTVYGRGREARDVARRRVAVGVPLGNGVRVVLGALCALGFVLVFPVTFYVYGARQVAFDVRFHQDQVEELGLYEALLHLGSDFALDAAMKWDPQVRRGVALLSDEDVDLTSRTVLPREWTLAVIEGGLEGTLAWLQADDARRVPPVSLPVHDLVRHLKDAASVAVDREVAELPVCASDKQAGAFCRPGELSVAAFVATQKPEGMAIVDDLFALIPAELDLSTLVTLAPREFRKPMAFLAEMRTQVHVLDRALGWAGAGVLVLLAVLIILCAATPRSLLGGVGATLLVGGIGGWTLSWVLISLGPPVVAERYGPKLRADLPPAFADLALPWLDGFARAVHALVSPGMLLVAGLGLALLLVGVLALRSQGRRMRVIDAIGVIVVSVAVVCLLWTTYLHVGRKLYDRASVAHREGSVQEAISLYEQVCPVQLSSVQGSLSSQSELSEQQPCAQS